MQIHIPAVTALVDSPRFQKVAWLLQQFEGFQAQVYTDQAGHPTIGYGHELIGSLTQDPELRALHLSLAQEQAGLTVPEAQELLAMDLLQQANIQQTCTTVLPEAMWVALTSFCFNIGLTSFLHSVAYQCLATQALYPMANSVASWREINGVFSPGLAKRRVCEVLILMQRPLSLTSAALPSQQWQAPQPLPYLDNSWQRLPLALKHGAVALYAQYQRYRPSLATPPSVSSPTLQTGAVSPSPRSSP